MYLHKQAITHHICNICAMVARTKNSQFVLLRMVLHAPVVGNVTAQYKSCTKQRFDQRTCHVGKLCTGRARPTLQFTVAADYRGMRINICVISFAF
jgi:hypothetical protein